MIDIIDRIEYLIMRDIRGVITDSESEELARWVQDSYANKMLREKLSSGEFLDEVMNTDDLDAFQKQWALLKSKTLDARRLKRRRRVFVAVAAVVLPLIIVTSIFYFKYDKNLTPESIDDKALVYWADGSVTAVAPVSSDNVAAKTDTIILSKQTLALSPDAFNRIVIPRGVDYVVKLNDGTIVNISPGSEMQIPVDFNSEKRYVKLSGRAFFNVTKDKSSPFVVKTKESEITVLGTRFDVIAYQNSSLTQATLVNGEINVSSGSSSTILKPGMQASVSSSGIIAVNEVNTLLYSSWIENRFVFDGQSVQEVMTEAARWYDFEFCMDDQETEQLKLTMNVPRPDDIDEFIKLIESVGKVKLILNGKTIHVAKL